MRRDERERKETEDHASGESPDRTERESEGREEERE